MTTSLLRAKYRMLAAEDHLKHKRCARRQARDWWQAFETQCQARQMFFAAVRAEAIDLHRIFTGTELVEHV